MMVEKAAVISVVLARLKKCTDGDTLELLTWKRDRSLRVMKGAENTFLVVEDGFVCEEFCVQMGRLPRLLRTIVKREFPRSRKVRMHVVRSV